MIRFENALKRSSQDVLKTSWRRFCKTSWRRFEDVLARRVEDVLKMSWRRLDDWSRRPEDVSKTSSEDVWVRRIYSSWSSCLEDVFWRRKTSSSRRTFPWYNRSSLMTSVNDTKYIQFLPIFSISLSPFTLQAQTSHKCGNFTNFATNVSYAIFRETLYLIYMQSK